MAWWWSSYKKDHQEPKIENSKEVENGLPSDLRRYLDTRLPENSISDRVFKETLESISIKRPDSKDDDTNEGNTKLNEKTVAVQKVEKPVSNEKIQDGNSDTTDKDVKPKGKFESHIFSSSSHQRPTLQTTERLSQEELRAKRELEEYLRDNSIDECVQVNCNDIQMKLMECLDSKSTLQKGECYKLQDFFSECTKIQRKSFKLFNFEAMDKIAEFETIKNEVDISFNKYFKDNTDVLDPKALAQYDRELMLKREAFLQKYGK